MSTPTTPHRFVLERATEADLPEITRLCWLSFPQHVRELLMGCPTEEDLPKLVGHFARTMREDHHAVWVKVVDRQAGGGGVIAAAALWKIYPGIAGAPTSGDELPPAWLEGETREESGKLLDEMNGARRRANPGGFVHLHICFTAPEHRRMGAARLLMQWGCDVADALSLPAWIEASMQGHALYKCYDFVDVGEFPGHVIYMRREPKTTLREGGPRLVQN